MSLSNNERGFSLLETTLVVVVVVLIGTAGWLVYHKHHATSAQSKVTTNYSGWKTYCSTIGGICIKYPPNWNIANDSGGVAEVAGQQEDGFCVSSYSGSQNQVCYSTTGGGDEAWTLPNSSVSFIKVAPSLATPDLQVVESITTDVDDSVNFPSAAHTTLYQLEYFVTTRANVNQYIAPAQKSGRWTDGYAEGFINTHASPSTNAASTGLPAKQSLLVYTNAGSSNYTHNSFMSYTAARNWLSSPTAKTLGLILDSVSYN